MSRSVLLSACGMLGLSLMAGSTSSATDPPAEKKAHGKDILGVWTLIHSEGTCLAGPECGKNPG